MATRPTQFPEHALTDVTLPVNRVDNKIRPDDEIRNVGWDQGLRPSAPELNWQFNNIYEWLVWLDQEEQDLPNNYYNKTELDGGQLDNRYYTETEIDANHYTKTAADAKFADVAGDTFTGAVQINSTLGVTGTATLGSATVTGNVAINGTPAASTDAITIGYSNSLQFTSADLTFAANATSTAAHGLAAVPKDFDVYLKCITTEHGYAAGALVKGTVTFFNNGTSNANESGFQVWADATNVNVRCANDLIILNTSGALARVTPANWRLVLRANK